MGAPNNQLIKKVDKVDDNYYIGWASPGTSIDNPSWKIQRITIAPIGIDVTVQWADANSHFDNIWSNRYSLVYG